jgi:hypothetical protein
MIAIAAATPTMETRANSLPRIPLTINIHSVILLYTSSTVARNACNAEARYDGHGNIELYPSPAMLSGSSADYSLEAQSNPHRSWHFRNNIWVAWRSILASSFTKACVVMIVLSLVITAISLILAVWWSVTRNDISGGCTLGGYVVSVSAVVVGIAGLLHRRRCNC